MAIQTRPHIQDNGCKLTPSFKKYFNKDFVINSLSKIAKRKSLKDKMYCEEGFQAQNFGKKKIFDFIIENFQFISMQMLQLTCFPLNFQKRKCHFHVNFSTFSIKLANFWSSLTVKSQENQHTSEIISSAFVKESSTPYATLTPMLDPALAGFTWKWNKKELWYLNMSQASKDNESMSLTTTFPE